MIIKNGKKNNTIYMYLKHVNPVIITHTCADVSNMYGVHHLLFAGVEIHVLNYSRMN